ncbi:MAG TPA: methyltransferase domain-containing protein [Geminicoccus sp.]|uniref:methyltransferase domain-containing protein n=1 Tax=Geminicoccus sp. TaxID=2024832 RepID=UPI002E373B44|nr:methyltransferase domain-containing protein [Geminicoccus sp.]HEX2528984.1 methyltransferase domain-containing protein [Geminicoccus sp.]
MPRRILTGALVQSLLRRAHPDVAQQIGGSMEAGSYIIRGGLPGRERLRLLARVMRPATLALLARAGVHGGMDCLDVGCGGGDVTTELARLVGPAGKVTGIDFDPVKVEIAREESAAFGLHNLQFQVGDVREDLSSLPAADLVYARFLLSHLPAPEAVLGQLVAHARPGGLVVLEDIQISGHVVHPPSWAHDAFVDLYLRTGRARGADPEIGPKLPGLLQAAGLVDVQAQVAQPVGLQGEMKLVSAMTMETIADAVLAAGLADHARIDAIVDELRRMAGDPATLVSIARVVQSWGRKPGPRP